MQMEEFGLPRVLEVVRANYRQTAPRLLQALSEAVEAHVNGAEVFDDMTLVVLKRSGA
jgi:serine phosphatase RsbU (regulator of sigma subunit)